MLLLRLQLLLQSTNAFSKGVLQIHAAGSRESFREARLDQVEYEKNVAELWRT